MQTVSTTFQATVLNSHTRRTRCVMRNPGGTDLITLTPNAGEVSLDIRRDVRRTCTDLQLVNTPNVDLIPAAATDTLSPLTDNEVAIFQSILLPTGVFEEVPLGVFNFQKVAVADLGTGGITVTLTDLADRSRIVTRSRWRTPFVIQGNTFLSDAITAGLTTCWAAVPPLSIQADRTVAALVVFSEGANSDPWKDLCKLAADHGCELFFDATGNPILRALPTPTSANIALTYTDGTGSPITSIIRSLSIADGDSYNGVIVSAESTSAVTPFRGEWWDNDDPSQPPARPRPLFVTSPIIASAAQAQSTAQALSPKYFGASEVLTWEQVSNPALDGWDLLHVVHPDVKGDTEVLLDAVTFPFPLGDTQKVTGRSRQVWG